jgi:hypothetical protein
LVGETIAYDDCDDYLLKHGQEKKWMEISSDVVNINNLLTANSSVCHINNKGLGCTLPTTKA